MSLGRIPKNPRRETSDIWVVIEGPEETRLVSLCTEGRRSKERSLESPAFVASCDSPMTRSWYRAAGIPPMIPEYTSNPQNSPGARATDRAVRECGGDSPLLGMIHAATTQATGRTTNKRGGGESPCQLKTDSRGWCYKAGLAQVEKGE